MTTIPLALDGRAHPAFFPCVDGSWSATADVALDAEGFVVVGPVLSPAQCAELAESYEDFGQFRKTVVMERHGFGRGTYRYFDDPLPSVVHDLRSRFYEALVPSAHRWNERLGITESYPPTFAEFFERCAAAGQRLPTPLLRTV